MPTRLFIAILAAVSTTCCPFDCLRHQAESVAYFVAWTTADAAPDGGIAPHSPPREQNESGCICRGAFFVEAPTVVPLDLAKWCPLVQNRESLSQTAELDSPGEFLDPLDLLWSPPLSGRKLRALHSSFLF